MAFRDIRKPYQLPTSTEIGFLFLVFILIAGLLRLDIFLARTYQRGEWLYLRWSGVRAHILNESEPYGSAVAQRVQAIVYGRDAYLNEYPYELNDPFYIVLLYFPLSFFSDFRIVQGIWMLFAQMAVVGVMVLALRLSEWDAPSWLYVVIIVFGVVNSFSVESFLSGSPAIFLLFLYLSILVALRSDANELAGGLLLFATYQWEVGALICCFILIIVIADGRWRVISGFSMTGIVLLVISLLAKSNWLVLYWEAVRFDWLRGVDFTAAITFSYLFPQIPLSIAGWVPFVVGGLVIYECVRSLYSSARHMAWAAFLALAFNPILGFPIFSTNHVMLLPALGLILMLAWERWTKQRLLVILLLLIVFLAFPYLLQYQVAHAIDRFYSDLARVVPPVLTVLGLYWMRWWVVRPPRIWADQFGLDRRSASRGILRN